jgi:NADPH:quinone reductase
VTALVRDSGRSDSTMQKLGADYVVEAVNGEFDLIVDAVGGPTFAASIEHVAPGGLVVNLATGNSDEVVSFRAARFDRAPGARIYTLNLFDELPGWSAAVALTRLVALMERGELVAPLELEASWRDVSRAIESLLAGEISGKAVLHVG